MTRARNEEEFMKRVGKRIALVRKQKGITQEGLAERVGLDRVAIAYIETGKRKPQLTSIFRIANGLGMSVEELLKDL